MDKEKISDLLHEALEEMDEDDKLDQLIRAINRLAAAIESRPYWYYSTYPNYSTGTWTPPADPPYKITCT